MNLNPLNNTGTYSRNTLGVDMARQNDQSPSASKNGHTKITLTENSSTSQMLEGYDKSGNSHPLNTDALTRISEMDKGIAAGTTVYVNRSAYDKIAYETTFGDVKWEEMGVDDDKRWIVVNGQRFECEHSPEEKALRRRMARMNLVDLLTDLEKNKKSTPKGNDNGKDKPRGNIESLQGNPVVMQLLGKIFNTDSSEEIFAQLA